MSRTRLRTWISLFVLVALLGAFAAPASSSDTERTVLPNGDIVITIYITPTPDNPNPSPTWKRYCGHCGTLIDKGTGFPPDK